MAPYSHPCRDFPFLSHVRTSMALEFSFVAMLETWVDFHVGQCNQDCTTCMDICPRGVIPSLTVEKKRRTRVGVEKFITKDCV